MVSTELEYAPLFSELEDLKTDFVNHKIKEASMVMVNNLAVEKAISIVRKHLLLSTNTKRE